MELAWSWHVGYQRRRGLPMGEFKGKPTTEVAQATLSQSVNLYLVDGPLTRVLQIGLIGRRADPQTEIGSRRHRMSVPLGLAMVDTGDALARMQRRAQTTRRVPPHPRSWLRSSTESISDSVNSFVRGANAMDDPDDQFPDVFNELRDALASGSYQNQVPSFGSEDIFSWTFFNTSRP